MNNQKIRIEAGINTKKNGQRKRMHSASCRVERSIRQWSKWLLVKLNFNDMKLGG